MNDLPLNDEPDETRWGRPPPCPNALSRRHILTEKRSDDCTSNMYDGNVSSAPLRRPCSAAPSVTRDPLLPSDLMSCIAMVGSAKLGLHGDIQCWAWGMGLARPLRCVPLAIPKGRCKVAAGGLLVSASGTSTCPKGMSSWEIAGHGACLPGRGHCMARALHIRKDHSQPPYSLPDAPRGCFPFWLSVSISLPFLILIVNSTFCGVDAGTPCDLWARVSVPLLRYGDGLMGG